LNYLQFDHNSNTNVVDNLVVRNDLLIFTETQNYRDTEVYKLLENADAEGDEDNSKKNKEYSYPKLELLNETALALISKL